MTSGEFKAVELFSIIINRDARQRRELKGIDELAESIRNRGLIHPPVITRDYRLVSGECRVEACKILGWTHIPIQWVDEVDLHELRAIELEENIKRVNLEWEDECLAVREYHENRRTIEPEWSQDDTQKALGFGDRSIVTDRLTVADAIVAGKIDPAKMTGISVALNILTRAADHARAEQEELSRTSIAQMFGATAPPHIDESILITDFVHWIKTYDGPRFNFIHCDFPFGIGAGKVQQGIATQVRGIYDDTPEIYRTLCGVLFDGLDRICSDSAHIVFWFSMANYTDTLRLLKTRFEVNPFPLVWFKSDNAGVLPDPQRGPRRIYETAFFGHRGDRQIVRAVSNAYAAPTVRDGGHLSEKPEPMLRYFFGMIVDQFTSIFDPTCGSGSALRAAESLGAKRVLGLEMNEEFAKRARVRLSQARTLKELSK